MTAGLRPANPLDAGAVGDILTGFVAATPWMPRVHNAAEHIKFADSMIARDWVTVATWHGAVVGFLAREGEEVHALYLAAEARGRGLGRALMAEAQRAIPRLALCCFAANAAARSFYLHQGFVEIGRSDGSSNDEGLPDVRYAWWRGAGLAGGAAPIAADGARQAGVASWGL